MDEVFDVIIIGAGAAGLTAGIYTSRAKLSTLILNEGAVGGQMVLTEEIANYPGVESVKGYELANIMKNQAKSFGCKIKSNIKISKYKFDGDVKEIELTDGTFIFVGYQPNTESLAGLVELNSRNEIVVNGEMKTNISGVFAAGDCINKRYRQVTTAVAEGTIAALSVSEYLRN